MKWIPILVFLILGAAVSILVESKRRKALLKYLSRACTGPQWKRQFPTASKAEIRAFLDLFVEAFLFHRKHRLSFSPDDRVMDVYHASYPPDWTLADAMELEFFAKRVRKTYGVDLAPLRRENITLGDLFAIIRPKSTEPCA